MSPEKRPRQRRSTVETEEDRAWVEFYKQVRSDAELATEVLAQLECDTEMKRKHLALFLYCRETLRRQTARQARHKRIGFFSRWLVRTLLATPWHALRNLWSESRDIAIEMLPEADRSPRPAPPALPPSPPSAVTPARRSRKARPDTPASVATGAEKAPELPPE